MHGQWNPHQLLTQLDRRRAARVHWQPFEPVLHACPRCLGEVMPSRTGLACVDHGHGHGAGAHGPFQVDELLGAAGQRESAMARERLARARERRARRPAPLEMALPSLDDVSHIARLAAAVALVAGTLAFLAR